LLKYNYVKDLSEFICPQDLENRNSRDADFLLGCKIGRLDKVDTYPGRFF